MLGLLAEVVVVAVDEVDRPRLEVEPEAERLVVAASVVSMLVFAQTARWLHVLVVFTSRVYHHVSSWLQITPKWQAVMAI